MKLFRIFLSFFLIAAVIFGVSLFFPNSYKVERSVTINKPVSQVYDFMNDFRNWERWSLWNKSADSTLVYFYGKRSDSTGGRQYFKGDLLGSGRFKFEETIPNQKIVYSIYMHEGNVGVRTTAFLFSGNDQQTQLTWLDSGYVGYNPLYRFMIPMQTSSTEKVFQDGLDRIKNIIEMQL